MATKQEIITAIDGKIIAKGNITAVDTNKILKDILEFSDKPVTPINGFDFGNVDKPLNTEELATVKVNFTGIERFTCSLYLCIEARIQKPTNPDIKDSPEWLFIPLKAEEFKILQSFLPNINQKQMYLTFTVPFFSAEIQEGNTAPVTGVANNNLETKNVSNRTSFYPFTIIGLGLLEDRQKQKGLHIILPEPGYISTALTLSYKPNTFKYSLFSKEMQASIDKILKSILEDNDLIFEEK
jgi:hypothetical protein